MAQATDFTGRLFSLHDFTCIWRRLRRATSFLGSPARRASRSFLARSTMWEAYFSQSIDGRATVLSVALGATTSAERARAGPARNTMVKRSLVMAWSPFKGTPIYYRGAQCSKKKVFRAQMRTVGRKLLIY